jgi:TolB-like protein
MYKIRNTILLVVLAFSILPAKQTLAVFDFQPVGVDSNTIQAASSLLTDRLSNLDTFSVISPTPGTKCYTIDEAVTTSKALNAEKAVIGNITQIGSKLIISYKLIDINTANVEFSDRASISSVEDLDIATDRIASAIKEKKPYAGTAEVGKITEIEEKPSRSRSPLSSVIFTTGYAFPLNNFFYNPGSQLFTIDAAVTYETPDLFTQGLIGLRRGKQRYTEIYFDLLAHKLFSKYDISPYIGGGIGVHKISFDPDDWHLPSKESDGLALTASGGVIIFRTYYFRVLAGLKATAVFTQDLGTMYTASLNFGLSSPTFGSEGAIKAPSPCIMGCLGVFFLTGVIAALVS